MAKISQAKVDVIRLAAENKALRGEVESLRAEVGELRMKLGNTDVAVPDTAAAKTGGRRAR